MVYPYVVAKRSKAVVVVLEGIVSVKVPAEIVWEPNVCTLTALLPCDELYTNTESNAVLNVTVVYTKEAEGVQYATPAVAVLLVAVGGVAFVTVTPPAV
jgi:hypothetical protein